MDVDDVIERHRRKLDAHRRELRAGSAEAAASSDDVTAAGESLGRVSVDADRPSERRAPVAQAASARGNTWADAGRRNSSHAPTGGAATPREVRQAPQRLSFTNAASPARSTTSSRYVNEYVTETPTALYERTQRWASQRDKAVAKQQEEKGALEVADCTFHPSRPRTRGASASASAAGTPKQRTGSPRVDTASYYTHIQRQEGARRDKQELQKRLDVDTSKWRQRTTVPREFDFAQRGGHISSLRKPCVGAELAFSDSDAEPSAAHHGGRSATEPGTARQPRSKTPPTSRPGGAPRGMPSVHDSAPDAPAGGNAADQVALERANTEIGRLSRELMHARAKAEHHEDEIARLGGTVVALKRELRAAKNKLRQYALGGDPPALPASDGDDAL